MCIVSVQHRWPAGHSRRHLVHLTQPCQRAMGPQGQSWGFPSPLTEEAKHAVGGGGRGLQRSKFRNMFKFSSLPSVSGKKPLFFLFSAKKCYPLNICSHIWLRVHDFFSKNNKFFFWDIKTSLALSGQASLYIEKAFETFHQWL